MPGVNLTRAEAQERSALVKVHSYDVDLDLTTGAETFIVKTRVKFDGLKPGATTYIDCVGSRVISAKLNGAEFDPKFDGETIYLPAIAAENIDVFTSSQILSMLIPQEVQSLTSVQLTSFKPSEVASLHAAELAYLDALHRATAGKAFEAPIPVMTEVAVVKPPVASLEVASIKPSPTAPSQAIVTAEAPARTGVLAVTILNSTDTKPLSAGVAYEQVADTVSLRATAAPAVPPLSDKVVFTDKLTTFMVAATNGEMVEFQGSLVNNRMVIVAPSLVAKRVARSEMNLVLAAAVTSLGKVNRVMLANLEGVVLDLR